MKKSKSNVKNATYGILRLLAITAILLSVFSLGLVSCRESNIPVQDISLGSGDIYAEIGEVITLKPTITPFNATLKSVSWATGDRNIAKIDETGKVEAIGVGQCTIKASLKDGSGRAAFCRLIVVDSEPQISLNRSTCNLINGSTFQLVASIEPFSSADIIYNSSNTNVATVTQEGIIKAVGRGTATITAELDNKSRSSASCEVMVSASNEIVSRILLGSDSITLRPNEKDQITATVYPSTAANKSIVWSSSNPSIVSVDSTGYIVAKKNGEVIITATAEDGSGVSAECSVKVCIPLEGIELNRHTLDVQVGDPTGELLYVNFTPENATNTKIIWTSSDESVATVDAGLVRVHKAGSAVITATSEDGGHRDSCSIGPIKRITSLTVTNNKNPLSNTLQLQVSDSSLTITPSVLPLDATNKSISFSSSDTSVARVSVDENNVCTVQPQKAGTCRIAARATDGSQKVAYVDLTVIAVVEEIHLYRGSPEAEINTQSMTEYNLVTNGNNVEGVKYVDISALCKPDNAHDKTLNWTTSDVYTISSQPIPDNRDDKRRITAANNGEAVITVGAIDRTDTSGFPLRYKQFKVKVTSLATGIEKNQSTNANGYTLTRNTTSNTKQLYATVLPSSGSHEARNKTVLWKTSNANVATVSSSGLVTAVKNGTATITAYTKDSDSENGIAKQVTWSITVETKANGINGSGGGTVYHNVNAKKSLTISAYGYDSAGQTVRNNKVTWSSNSSCVSISGGDTSCTVTGVSNGTATITAKAQDGGYTKTFTVTSKKGVTGVTVSRINTNFTSSSSEDVDCALDYALISHYTMGMGTYSRVYIYAQPDDADNRTLYESSKSENLPQKVGGVDYTGTASKNYGYYYCVDTDRSQPVCKLGGKITFNLYSADGCWSGSVTLGGTS